MRRWVGLTVLACLLVVGCGGTGTSTGFGGGSGMGANYGGATSGSRPDGVGVIPTGRRFAVYVTTATAPGIDRAWVSIRAIEALREGQATKVFEDRQGRVVDLAALAGRHLFLGEGATSGGEPTQVRVTLGDEMVLIREGSAEARRLKFADSRGGEVQFTVGSAGTRLVRSGAGDWAIDLDLPAWTFDSAVVARPKEGQAPGEADLQRQMPGDYLGQIRDLATRGEGREFTLLDPSGRTLRIAAASELAAELADGQAVVVRGLYDPNQRRVTAHLVRPVEDLRGTEWGWYGVAAMPNAEEARFTLRLEQARGPLPDRLTFVVDAGQAEFRRENGAPLSAAEFRTRLEQAKVLAVGVQGVLDPEQGRLAARIVQVEPVRR